MVALPLKKSFSDLTREPMWVATALSIGLHGLFWLASPILIPTTAPNTPTKQSVRMVQLSLVGQTRLPATLSSTDAFSSNVPLVSPLPNNAFSQFPGGQMFNSSSVPRLNGPMYQLSDLPPPPPVSWTMPNLPPVSPPLRTDPPREPQPQVSLTAESVPVATPTPESTPTESAANDTTSATPTPAVTPTPTGGRSPSPTSPTTIDPEYAYSAEGTTAIDGTEQLMVWLEKARKIAGDPALQPQKLQEPLVIREYPLKRCLANPKPAAVAVLVDPNGKVTDAPKLLTSSGYGILNRAALDTLRSRDFPKSDGNKYTIYTLNVDFQLDNQSCPPDAASAPKGTGKREERKEEL